MNPRNNPYNTLLMQAAGVAMTATTEQIAALPVPPGRNAAEFRAEFAGVIDKIVRFRLEGNNAPAAAVATVARFDYVAAWDGHDDPPPSPGEAETDPRRIAEAIANPWASATGRRDTDTDTADENDPHAIAAAIARRR